MFFVCVRLNWVWNTILNALIFPAPLMAVFSFVNTVAIVNTSTAALPVGTILVMFALFVLVTFPLSVIGAIAGRYADSFFFKVH